MRMSIGMKMGGFAFPVPGIPDNADFYGMSMRDYFAAHAPITLAEAKNHWHAMNGNGSRQPSFLDVTDTLALMRGQYADAMIAERSK